MTAKAQRAQKRGGGLGGGWCSRMGTLGKSKQIQVNPTKRDRRRNGRKKAHTAQKGGRDWVEGWCSRVGTLGKSDQIQANPTKSDQIRVIRGSIHGARWCARLFPGPPPASTSPKRLGRGRRRVGAGRWDRAECCRSPEMLAASRDGRGVCMFGSSGAGGRRISGAFG